jgi:4-hydroxybenzoyl-CoA thioesterase
VNGRSIESHVFATGPERNKTQYARYSAPANRESILAQHVVNQQSQANSPPREAGSAVSGGYTAMFVNRTKILVEFGDCDPADIVFYPNYFRWFDHCTAALFRAAGLPLRELFKSHGVLGIPIVDARARFIVPSTFGEELEVESSVTEWRKSSFVITHRFFRKGVLLLEGWETRVWAAAHPTDAHRMRGIPLPQSVIQTLSRKRKDARRKR